MPSVINTNIASLNAQRNLTMSQTSLATSLQRLSSGLRINSAKDDAAGLAISDRFSTQIRGINQAIRNANDGISLAQTAEGALAETTNNLQRVRELAVQATNSTNNATDRAAINLEVQQRLSEIDRTAAQTSFNGTKLLDGSFGTANFQVGANVGETISVGLSTNVRLAGAGAIATATSAVLGASATGGSATTGAITATNFSTAGSAATSGKLVISPPTRNFATAAVNFAGGATNAKTVATTDFSVAGSALTSGSVSFTATDFNFQALIAGKSSPQTVTSFDNDGTSALIAGTNVQGSSNISQFNFSGAALAQFNVTDGITTANITLNANYTDVNGLAAAIQTQVQAAGGNLATTTVGNSSGTLTFTNVGQTAAIQVTNVDVNAAAANFAASAGVAGAAANAAAALTIDGTVITMNTDSVNIAGFAADLTTKMQASALGANYSASVVSGAVVITHATSTTAVAITAANAKAVASGIANSAGVAGTASSSPSTLTIGGTTVTLDQNYGSYTNMAADISTQLGASYTVTADANGDLTTGDFKISRTSTGAASTAVDIVGDAASTTAGITSGGGNTRAGTAGTNLVATTNATFTVGATAVTLNTNLTNRAGVLASLQSQLSGYNVTDSGTAYTFTSLTSSSAVAVSGASAGAVTAGFTNSAGVAGTAAVTTNNANLTIDGRAITLNTDYASFDAMAASIETKMDTAAGADTYTVTNNAGAFTITKNATGLASTGVAISVADAGATAAGLGVAAGTTTNGANAVPTSNATFTVDGQSITLNGNDSANLAAVVSELNTKLDAAFTPGAYLATASGSGIKITNTTMGSAAVEVSVNTSSPTQAETNATTAGFGSIASTADGVAAGSVTLANFSINGTSMAGSYDSTSALATAINASVSNVYASVTAGALKLTSSAALELGGAEATGALGYASSTIAADSGNLSTANTLSVDNANTMIQRVDSALSSVSTLRSTLGAAQNRFDSVIASLSSTSENLSTARSRIQDADFAAETATLTRNQILQQAGVAMLAQANSLPQSVLALLK